MQHRAASTSLGGGGGVGTILDVHTHVALEHRVIRVTETGPRERQHDIGGDRNRNTTRNEIGGDGQGERDVRATSVLRGGAKLREISHWYSSVERVRAGVDLIDARASAERRARASQLGIEAAHGDDDPSTVRALLLTLECFIDERLGG